MTVVDGALLVEDVSAQGQPPSSAGELNGLPYDQSRVLAVRSNGDVVGIVRTAVRTVAGARHGLITDLRLDDPEDHTVERLLFDAAEARLRAEGVTKIDALVPDGIGLAARLLDRSYWASRKSVVMDFDLHDPIAPAAPPDGIQIRRAAAGDVATLVELVLSSYQPYWRWWREADVDRRWERVDYPAPDALPTARSNGDQVRTAVFQRLASIINADQAAVFAAWSGTEAVGLCDADARPDRDQLDFGVLVRRDFGGRRLGSALLTEALAWLRDHGLRQARVTTTSGLDDYDPTVYLYSLTHRASIAAELVDFVLHPGHR